MAPRQANRNIQSVGRQCSVPTDEQARPQGIKKGRSQTSPRKSLRLQRLQERTVSKDTNTQPKHPLPSLTTHTPKACMSLSSWYALELTQVKFPQAREQERKRKRSRQPERSSSLAPSEPLRKQRRTALADGTIHDQRAASGINNSKTNSIAYWSEERSWPKEYFNQDDQTRKDFETYNGIPWSTEMGLNHLLARRKSSSSLRGKQSEAGSVTPSSTTASDEKPREAKVEKYPIWSSSWL